MKWFQIFFTITLCNSLLFAVIHENAEDATTFRWKVLTPSKQTKILNAYDKEKHSRVIKLQGEGTKSAFKLDSRNMKQGEGRSDYWLSWDMKYSEEFIIMVIVGTNRGKDYLLYTPSEENSYKQYGLGKDSMDGKWHNIKRNLQADLAYYDNRENIISICSFVIRGSGSIDNVITKIKTMPKVLQPVPLPIHPPVKRVEPKKQIQIQTSVPIQSFQKKRSNSLPIIKIRGANPLHLNLGEPYLEQGVYGEDKEDGKINVVSTEDIDIYKSGEYLVMYMATDSDGNVALDKRKVYVGNEYAKVKKRVVQQHVLEVAEERQEEEEAREEMREEQEVAKSRWEEALEQREKELEAKENEIGLRERNIH